METTHTHLSVLRRTLLTFAVAAVVVIATVLAVSLEPRPASYDGDIPLPFSQQGSDVRGSILYYGKRNSIDVYQITFLQNERTERMQTDIIYLVHVPVAADVVTTYLDDVISTVSPVGLKNVDYYGYKYSDAVATAERAAVGQPLFKNRFPAKFFASQKARNNDPAHQNALATFETQNAVTFLKTDATAGAVRLEPGSLYAFVVNEPSGANIAIRTPICQNGILESAEVCDDGNANDADCCKNDCSGILPIPFGGTCSSASSSSSQTASSVASSQASSQTASSVASSQGSSASSGVIDAAIYLEAPTTISPGEYMTYKITASNMGPSSSQIDVTFRISPREKIGFVRNLSDSRCNFTNNEEEYANYVCNLGVVPASQSINLNMVFGVFDTTNCPQSITTSALLHAQNDTNHQNNTVTNVKSITCTSSSSSSATSSQASSAASSQSAVVYPLSLVVQPTPATATATVGQAGLSLLKFRATAGMEPVLLKGVMLTTQEGTLANATQYQLYRSGVTEAVASATPANNKMTFFRTDGLGTVIAAGASADFEVRATAATVSAAGPSLSIQLYTTPSNYVIATVGGEMLDHIRTNGTCLFPCSINVTTAPSTLWTFTEASSACGDNTPDAGCEAGPSAQQSCTAPYDQTCTYCSPTCKIVTVTGPYCGDHISDPIEQKAGADGIVGTADDEECDDGDTDDDDTCSNDCKMIAAPF